MAAAISTTLTMAGAVVLPVLLLAALASAPSAMEPPSPSASVATSSLDESVGGDSETLQEGTCIDSHPAISSEPRVPCSQPHLAQVVALVETDADCADAVSTVRTPTPMPIAYWSLLEMSGRYGCWVVVEDPDTGDNLRVVGSLLDGTAVSAS